MPETLLRYDEPHMMRFSNDTLDKFENIGAK
jgi:hypothetical protein